jgi:hypothetical protein
MAVKRTYRLHLTVSVAVLVALVWGVPAMSESAATRTAAGPATAASWDKLLWDWLKDTRDRSQLERFIRLYPDSPYVGDAQARLDGLSRPSAVLPSLSTRECSGFWCWWPHSSFIHGVGY